LINSFQKKNAADSIRIDHRLYRLKVSAKDFSGAFEEAAGLPQEHRIFAGEAHQLPFCIAFAARFCGCVVLRVLNLLNVDAQVAQEREVMFVE
jgi:hypothetical protein